MSSHDATFYVQLQPTFYLSRGEHQVREIRAVALNQKKPNQPRAGTVLVKLTVRVPDGAFLPLRPEAVIVVPEEMTVTSPIEVQAEDPHEQ
jgi:hypothetical protein